VILGVSLSMFLLMYNKNLVELSIVELSGTPLECHQTLKAGTLARLPCCLPKTGGVYANTMKTFFQPTLNFVRLLAKLQCSASAATYVIRHKNKNSPYYDRLSRTSLIGSRRRGGRWRSGALVRSTLSTVSKDRPGDVCLRLTNNNRPLPKPNEL